MKFVPGRPAHRRGRTPSPRPGGSRSGKSRRTPDGDRPEKMRGKTPANKFLGSTVENRQIICTMKLAEGQLKNNKIARKESADISRHGRISVRTLMFFVVSLAHLFF